MQLAMYKGPPHGWRNKLGHWIVCIGTFSRYSHAELVIDGTCYSSSWRDGGVRAKIVLDLETSGRWDLYPVAVPAGMSEEGMQQRALQQFARDQGKGYSWRGMLRTCPLLRWLPRRDTWERFCSDQVAAMLGATDPETFTPADLVDAYAEPW